MLEVRRCAMQAAHVMADRLRAQEGEEEEKEEKDRRGAVHQPILPVYYRRPAPVIAVHPPAVGVPMHARSHSAALVPMQPTRPVASHMHGMDDHRWPAFADTAVLFGSHRPALLFVSHWA